MTMLVPVRSNLRSSWPSLTDLEARLDEIFRGFPAEATRPAVDLSETDEAYVLEADLPGLKKEDIELTVEDEVVTLKGTRKQETEDKSKGYHRIERNYGEFRRSFRISGGVDTAKVEASFKDGVLRVTLPKPEARKPKQIEVKVN